MLLGLIVLSSVTTAFLFAVAGWHLVKGRRFDRQLRIYANNENEGAAIHELNAGSNCLVNIA